MTKTVVLLTDFTYDYYQGVMKSVIAQSDQTINFIDLPVNHHQSKINASWILYNSIDYIPKGSIILIVVDPGVGTERNGIVVKIDGKWIVTPDNGIISPLKNQISEVYKLKEDNLKSSTFHGRDLFSPAVKHLLVNLNLDEFTEKIENIDTSLFDIKPENETGIVVDLDSFGNVITNIKLNQYEINKILKLRIGDSEKEFKFVQTFANLEIQEVGCLIGSCGTIEIVKNQGSANEELLVRIGTTIKVIQ